MSNLVNQTYKFSLHPEMFRFIAYIAFWVMVIVAHFVTIYFVKPNPFEYDNPVRKLSGYDNICVNWDFEPALSTAAIIYVFVELPLLTYIVLEWLRAYIATNTHGRGGLKKWEYCFIKWFSLVSFFFVCLFRMIFVIHAIENTIGHTVGFIGLQLALMLNAMSSFLFYRGAVFEDARTWVDRAYKWAGITYLILLGFFTVAKLTITIRILTHHPIWPIPSINATFYGKAADYGWMFLAAVCPLFISFFLWCYTPAIDLALTWRPGPHMEFQERGYGAVNANDDHEGP